MSEAEALCFLSLSFCVCKMGMEAPSVLFPELGEDQMLTIRDGQELVGFEVSQTLQEDTLGSHGVGTEVLGQCQITVPHQTNITLSWGHHRAPTGVCVFWGREFICWGL